jgi:hypothetical protein
MEFNLKRRRRRRRRRCIYRHKRPDLGFGLFTAPASLISS